MAKSFVNVEKLNIPKNSANGIVSVLLVNGNGEIKGLDSYLKSNP